MVIAGFSLVCVPSFILPPWAARWSIRSWARTNEWLLARICGLTFEIRGEENFPVTGALVASKHQSAWETMSYLHILSAPAMVLKKELLYLPFFGWYALKARHLWVDRGGRASALRSLLRRAREASEGGRQVLIFPEGTRKKPGASPEYQRGLVALYREMKVPCVPVALNSGLYWPRRDWKRRPGTIIVEFCEAIPPGLGARDFMATLETRIETATASLVDEGRRRHQ